MANIEPDTFEEILERLAKRHRVVRPAGFRDYRNGPSPCYECVHALYREVVYGRIGPARRRKLHKSLAETAEALRAFPEAVIAAELAYQFEESGDWLRAIKYLQLAADTAGRRFEPRQAAEILEHGLELVNKIAEAERAQSEIAILGKLANIYQASYDPRAAETYEALAGRAAHYGLAEVEAGALLEMAFPLALVSGDPTFVGSEICQRNGSTLNNGSAAVGNAARDGPVRHLRGAGQPRPHEQQQGQQRLSNACAMTPSVFDLNQSK